MVTMGPLDEVTKQFIALWITIDGIITFLDFMNFLNVINSTYEPTTSAAIIYCVQIMLYLVRNAIISAVIAFPVNWLLRKMGLKVSL